MTDRLTRRHFLAGLAALGAAPAARGQDDPPPEAARDATITPEAQRAIDRGLAYLAREQHDDGSWGDRQQYYGNVAVTSLCGLALMAGGHQPGRGEYGSAVTKALQFVLNKERPTPAGFLYNPTSSHAGPMYSHGFGALFLGEAHGMIPDRALQTRVRETLGRAVQVIVNSQNAEGGWRYQPEPRQADVSVTICQIMALRSARNAGLAIPKSTVDACVKYVRECQNADGGFSYFRSPPNPSAFARSAAGLVALYSAGVYQGREVERALRYLTQFKPGGLMARDVPNIHYFYGQYYAAQAMWTAGGAYWGEWYPAIRDELVGRSRLHPQGAWVDLTTCNHYATAMACIILQIPNNYLPILQK